VTGYTLQVSFASNVPSIISDGTGVINGGSYAPGQIVSGSWVAVKGAGFTDAGVTADWSNSDFSNGLPKTLRDVQVLFNGQPGAVWYLIDGTPQQINVQAPASLNGNVSVQVTRGGTPSNTVTTTAVQVAPGIFSYTLDGGKTFYPSAVFLDGTRLGDPALFPGARKAKAGDVVLLFANSLAPSAAGVVSVSGTTHQVLVTIGSTTFPADFSGLVAPGEFQINMTVPALPPGSDYTITIQIDGVSSQAGVHFPYSN
ncbi:MAG: IPT/TIG domain-containing protein, partial [Acidobacteriia bacterium]|nr:IPT/TIG domain-containing protein [Terriglobia bacterium]